MSDTTTHAIPGHDTAQEALDAALAKGGMYHDAGYMVSPPWYRPVPISGTYPLSYTYEGRFRFGTTQDALYNLFYSHLHALEHDAIEEAYDLRAQIVDAGYQVGNVGVQTITVDGHEYYEALFHFGFTGVELPDQPFEERRGTPWYVWAVPITLAAGTLVLVLVGRSR